MKGKRYSNEQIIYALKRVEGGEKASELCRQMGGSEASFYKWKKKFGGMGVSEAGEDENRPRISVKRPVLGRKTRFLECLALALTPKNAKNYQKFFVGVLVNL